MPDGQISSFHPRHHHRQSTAPNSSRSPVAVAAVAVAISPSWLRSSTSTSTDSRHQHRQYHDPSRPAPLFSHSLNAQPHLPATARLPRTSSLLPPPQITPASRSSPREQSNHLSPVSAGHEVPHNAAESSWLLNRWSTSTVSSRASAAPQRAPTPASRFGSRSSIDATRPSSRSSPSSKPSPRKLQKNRRPSASSVQADVSAPKAPEQSTQLPEALPPIASLSPLEPPALSELLAVKSKGTGTGSPEPGRSTIARESQSLTNPGTTDSPIHSVTSTPASARSMASYRPTMPYDQDHEAYAPNRGHSRSRSGKSSHDKGRGPKPPSQKAMLSRALQKANTAVQLDNAQNFEGAREAYAEACDLLQQVLQKTTADEDKRKLEAIVSWSAVSSDQY